MSLKQKTIFGIFWSILQKVGSRGITFLVTIVLARILTPKDFGLIGMLMVLIALSQVVVDAGFSQALIQKKNPDEEDYSSVFYINLTVCILMYGVLYFCAPLVADFYRQPLLIDLTRVLSLVFVINAFSYVQEAKLTKEMRFKTLAIIHVPSSLIGGGVSIVMARMGYGVWSIVALQVVQRFAYAIQIWIYSKWKPLLTFNWTKAKKLFSFGGKLMVAGMLDSVFKRIYLVFIGRFFPLTQVGYYQNADNLSQQPSSTLSGALSLVTFSAFSTLQDDKQKLKRGYKEIIQHILMVICPLFILAGVLAKPLFILVFTLKWIPSIGYFQILIIVGIFYPLNAFNENIITVVGRSDLFLRLTIVKRVITIVGILVTIPLGIWYLILFQAVNSIINYIINSHYSGKFINYSTIEQVKDILPILLISIISGGIVMGFIYFSSPYFSNLVLVVSGFIIGLLSYFGIMKALRYKGLEDVILLFSSRFKKRKAELKYE